MLKFQGGRLLRVFDLLHCIEKLARSDPTAAHGNGTYRKSLTLNIEMLIGQLEILNTAVSIKKARTILMYVSAPIEQCAPTVFVELIAQSLEELRDRIKDELDDRTLYCLESKQAELWLAGQDTFGNEVLDAFPEASTDMSEAVACLVWSRYTACVFHLMRTMESALQEAGRTLGATVIAKDGVYLAWGQILRNMDGAIGELASEDEGSIRDT